MIIVADCLLVVMSTLNLGVGIHQCLHQVERRGTIMLWHTCTVIPEESPERLQDMEDAQEALALGVYVFQCSAFGSRVIGHDQLWPSHSSAIEG